MAPSPSYRVVEAVAREEGVSATELSPPLFRVVDPDALDALVQADPASNTEPMEIAFRYQDYVVRVRGGPTVSVSVQADAVTDHDESVVGERADSGQ